jgi:hypothetical protein
MSIIHKKTFPDLGRFLFVFLIFIRSQNLVGHPVMLYEH